MKLVRDIMHKEVRTVPHQMTVREFARFLLQHDISGAPVVDDTGRMLGMATASDVIFRDTKLHLPTAVVLLDAVIYLENPGRFEADVHKMLGQTVADIMTRQVISVQTTDTITFVATVMTEKKHHLLPVLENDQLVGIVGKADMIRAMADEI
jgi:CBS domain-containing protein